VLAVLKDLVYKPVEVAAERYRSLLIFSVDESAMDVAGFAVGGISGEACDWAGVGFVGILNPWV